MSERQIPTLVEMNPWGRTVATSYYEAGVRAGITEGRRQVEDEVAAQWRHAYESSQMIARTPSYVELAERRGEVERADRQRQILLERGITR